MDSQKIDERLMNIDKQTLEDDGARKVSEAIIKGLAALYNTLYCFDIDTGAYSVRKLAGKSAFMDGYYESNDNYFAMAAAYIGDVVYPEDKERVLQYAASENLKQELAHKKVSTLLFRRKNDRGEGYIWMEHVNIKLEEADEAPHHIIAAFVNKDEEIREHLEQKRQLEESRETIKQEKRRFGVVKEIISSAEWSLKLAPDDRVYDFAYSPDFEQLIDNDLATHPFEWSKIIYPDDYEAACASFYAAIADHSGKTPYNADFRMLDRKGNYNWFHVAGRVRREADGSGEIFGVHVNINKQKEAEQRRALGALPLSPDILIKAQIGLWAFELDEGKPPRMYVDEAMRGLLGIKRSLLPEDTYLAWYNNIQADSRSLVDAAVAKMKGGEHAEVQYPWHQSDGHLTMVRCGGVRNYAYKAGIRIEGTHQNVSEVVHFDEQEMARLKKAEVLLKHELFRSNALDDFLVHNVDTPPIELLKGYAEMLRELLGCDQVYCRNLEGDRVIANDKAYDKEWTVPVKYCRDCRHFDILSPIYKDGYVEMANCRQGWNGVMVHEECPVKSGVTRILYCDEKPAGYIAVHYIREYHWFTDLERSTLREFARIVSVAMERYRARKENRELKIIAEMKQNLEDALKMAQSANQAKTNFLNNMSHDIRTPMNAIIGFTRLANKYIDDRAKLKGYLGKVEQSSEHLLSLINDVLDMSRIESGKIKLDEKAENLGAIVKGVLTLLQSSIAEKQHHLSVQMINVRDKNVFCDKLRLNQILINIISNAIKYTPNGGQISFVVTERGLKADGKVAYEFCITDNGMGMEKEFLEVLFDPFTRVKSSTMSGIQGTGLGMAITKNLVDMLGGTIEVESEVGKGTVVRVNFDFQVATEDGKGVKTEDLVTYDFNGKKVLLVEDNELNTEIAVELLNEFGCIVDIANDGDVAVAKMQAAQPGDYDLVLMDIQMPRMDGYEATREIRALGTEISRIPILAMTANAFESDRQKALASGMNAHIPKPIDIEMLKETMAKFV